MSDNKAVVLIADDEKLICTMASQFLTKIGYQTVTVPDFPSTFKEIEDNPGKFGLVILDFNMPGGIGDEAYYKIREIDSLIKVMLSTGKNLEEKLLNDIMFNNDLVLMKPYRLTDMAEKVREALNG